MTAEVGDVFRYSNGNEYVITEGGPVVMSTCAACGAPAGTTFDYRVSDVRCGRCLAERYELLPGQVMYNKIADWQVKYREAYEASRARP